MKDSKSNEIIAIEIVKSWKNESSNHILVAPPLTDPENIFKKLKNKDFLIGNDLDFDKLNIASPSPFTYRDPNKFIKKIIRDWEINFTISEDNDYLESLEEAVEIIYDDGNIPIILLPNFHKIIQSLSWELGALLRELEHQYNLRTVVQLPIPLTRLRERWEIQEGKEAFISSDFGQGHSSLVLTGYSDEEVKKIGYDHGLDDKLVNEIIRLAGSLPDLVTFLCREAKNKNPHSLRNYAKQQAKEQCQRFIDWLDAPDETSFRDALANIQTGTASQEDVMTVRAHDWNKLLINKNDKLKSEIIGYACIDHGSVGRYREYMMIITETIKKSDYINALKICSNLPKQFLSNKNILLTIDLIGILKSIATLTPNWADTEKICSLALKKLNKINYKQLDNLKNDLNTLKKISQQMKNCLKVSKNYDWRITDCLCGREQFKNIGQISVAIVWQKLFEAQKIKEKDYTAAMSGILAIPEQILQIYCSQKLNLNVWNAQEYGNDIKEEVNKLWSISDFKFPTKGSRLSFNHLLYIGMAKMNLLPNKNERLFLKLDEIVKLNEIYGKERGESAHSLSMVDKTEWEEYYKLSCDLLNKLSIILFNKKAEETLPSLDRYIYELVDDTSDLNEA